MAQKELIRIIKDWNWPDLLRQTPHSAGVWGNYQFTTEPVKECDYVIVLNNRTPFSSEIRCPAGRVWSVMQEPYIPGMHDWMIEDLQCYDKIFTHFHNGDDPRYISAQPLLPWHINRSFDQLITMPMPEKSKTLSWIFSRLAYLPMHRQRLAFKHFLESTTLDIHVYGRGFDYLTDKWDGLAPFYYSLAVENYRGPDYWSEKFADAILSYSVPIYYGCTNMHAYFPAESYIEIDLENFQASLEKIRALCHPDDWRRRLPAVREARDLILHKYQFFPYITSHLMASKNFQMPLTQQTLPAYGDKKWRHLRRYLLYLYQQRDYTGFAGLIRNKLFYLRWNHKSKTP